MEFIRLQHGALLKGYTPESPRKFNSLLLKNGALGKLLSNWEGNFSGAKLFIFGRVVFFIFWQSYSLLFGHFLIATLNFKGSLATRFDLLFVSWCPKKGAPLQNMASFVWECAQDILPPKKTWWYGTLKADKLFLTLNYGIWWGMFRRREYWDHVGYMTMGECQISEDMNPATKFM